MRSKLAAPPRPPPPVMRRSARDARVGVPGRPVSDARDVRLLPMGLPTAELPPLGWSQLLFG